MKGVMAMARCKECGKPKAHVGVRADDGQVFWLHGRCVPVYLDRVDAACALAWAFQKVYREVKRHGDAAEDYSS
jgi:hypothetical protein